MPSLRVVTRERDREEEIESEREREGMKVNTVNTLAFKATQLYIFLSKYCLQKFYHGSTCKYMCICVCTMHVCVS